MQRETARQLIELLLKHSKEQNDLLQNLLVAEPDSESKKIKSMIGRTMGSMYLDAMHPILTEHPDLTPIALEQ